MESATPQTDLPAWQFSSQWRPLPGVAHGTRQPTMLGYWDGYPGHWDRTALDQAIAAWIPQSVPAPPEGTDTDDAKSLLRRLLFWTGAVQRQHKVPVFDAAYFWHDPDARHGHRVQIAMPYASREASLIALRWVEHLVRQALHGQSVPTAEADAFAQALLPYQLRGYNSIRFLQAAHDLDLPWRVVVPGVFALGYGIHARWLESSYTDRTPVLGTRLARNKFRTAQLLRQLGLPAPIHARASSAQHAVALARQIGYPVVVKPADRDQGQGVSADLRDDAAVLAAFAHAAACSDYILVEKHADGKDYRLTIQDGKLIKTIVRRPAGVLGDGRQTIAALVECQRHDQEQVRLGQAWGHAPLVIDAEALAMLAQHGLRADSVPAQGQFTPLRRRANVSAGGTPMLVHGTVHPDNRRLAERAAQALQLDLAGVDLIMPDIADSWLQTGALICEVNGQPQLGASTTPGIYRQVLRNLLPPASRIPVVLVVDVSDTVARQLHTDVADRMPPWGLACADGVWEGQHQVAAAQSQGFAAARILVNSRSIAAAIVAMTPAQILHSGLPFDRIHVLVVAGLDAARDWTMSERDVMWRMVLPHVDTAVICAQPCVPDTPVLLPRERQGPAWLVVGDDRAELAQATRPYLSVSPATQCIMGGSADA